MSRLDRLTAAKIKLHTRTSPPKEPHSSSNITESIAIRSTSPDRRKISLSGGTSPSLEVSPRLRMPRYVDDKAASDLKVYLFHGGIVCKPTEKRNKGLVSHVQPLTALKSQSDA